MANENGAICRENFCAAHIIAELNNQNYNVMYAIVLHSDTWEYISKDEGVVPLWMVVNLAHTIACHSSTEKCAY